MEDYLVNGYVVYLDGYDNILCLSDVMSQLPPAYWS